MEQRSDQALAAEMARGGTEALRGLYRRYDVQTFNLLARLTGNRELARDMLQETFIRVWQTAGHFDPQLGTFKAWLFTIALNLTRSELRKRRYHVTHVDVEPAEGLACEAERPDEILARAERRRAVAAALASLQPYLREVIVLKVYHQLKFREIAAITRMPEGTLKARFHRAVMALREKLGPSAEGRA